MNTLRLLHDISTPNDQSATALAVRSSPDVKGVLAGSTQEPGNLGFCLSIHFDAADDSVGGDAEATERRDNNPLGIAVVFATVPGLLPTAWMGHHIALMVPYMAWVGWIRRGRTFVRLVHRWPSLRSPSHSLYL